MIKQIEEMEKEEGHDFLLAAYIPKYKTFACLCVCNVCVCVCIRRSVTNNLVIVQKGSALLNVAGCVSTVSGRFRNCCLQRSLPPYAISVHAMMQLTRIEL